jgi:hypothetical protein
MEKRLSSRLVPILRWVILPLWVLALGGALFTQWPESTPLGVLLVCGWILSSAVLLAVAFTLNSK